MRIDAKAVGLAFGLVWGIGLFILTWWIMLFEGATHDLLGIGYVYRGFNVSPLGSVFGLIWGLADGFVGGVIFGWLYNLFAKAR